MHIFLRYQYFNTVVKLSYFILSMKPNYIYFLFCESLVLRLLFQQLDLVVLHDGQADQWRLKPDKKTQPHQRYQVRPENRVYNI